MTDHLLDIAISTLANEWLYPGGQEPVKHAHHQTEIADKWPGLYLAITGLLEVAVTRKVRENNE